MIKQTLSKKPHALATKIFQNNPKQIKWNQTKITTKFEKSETRGERAVWLKKTLKYMSSGQFLDRSGMLTSTINFIKKLTYTSTHIVSFFSN